MGFKDIFTRKVQEQDAAAAGTQEQQRQEALVRQGVQAEVEPKLRALVGEVFEAMASAKWPSIPVEGASDVAITAYALGSFHTGFSGSTWANADAVVDSQGRLAFLHRVEILGQWPDQTAVSTGPLDEPYERLLGAVERTDEPGRPTLTITTADTLMYCRSSYDARDQPVYTYLPLEEYLANLAAMTLK